MKNRRLDKSGGGDGGNHNTVTAVTTTNYCDRSNRKIRELLMYRNNIKRDSTSSKILEMSYDGVDNDNNYHHNDTSEFFLSDISKRIKKPYKFTKKIVLELKYSGYIDNSNSTRGSYSLTQKGRWFALCQTLDGIPFLSLCLLAETYHRVKSNPEFFYQFSVFRQFYEKDYNNNNNQDLCLSTAIYHRTNISKSLKHLMSRNLVYFMSGDFIKMTKHMIEFLKKYDKELDSLFLWCSDTYENCTSYVIENNDFGFDISRIIPKGSN